MKIKNLIALILLSLILFVSMGLNVKQFIDRKSDQQRIEDLSKKTGKTEVINRYTHDKVEHTVFKEKLVTNKTAEKNAAIGKTYADSITKALKVSLDRIHQVTKINAELVAKLQLKEQLLASGKKVKSYEDKYLTAKLDEETDSLDFTYKLKLNDVRYSKKKWLLGRSEKFIDVWSEDPRITINGLNTYTLKEQNRGRWGIGISTGYGLGFQNNELKHFPYFGIGINYQLIEF